MVGQSVHSAVREPLVVQEPGGPTAEDFFTFVAPRLIQARRRVVMKAGGKFGFSITGTGGGKWTLDFGAATIRTGLVSPEVLVHMAEADFVQILKGTLDIGAAMKAGRIRCEGRIEKLAVLAACFQPA